MKSFYYRSLITQCRGLGNGGANPCKNTVINLHHKTIAQY